MVIKAVSGPKCMKHNMECNYVCSWCAKPICYGCVEFAQGKKYCDKCWAKKQQTSKSTFDEEPVRTAPRTPVRNVDPNLNPDMAKQTRTQFEQPKKRIVNEF